MPGKLRAALAIPERYDILLILALGKPAETVVLADAGRAGGSSYGTAWRFHQVPERTLGELIAKESGSCRQPAIPRWTADAAA